MLGLAQRTGGGLSLSLQIIPGSPARGVLTQAAVPGLTDQAHRVMRGNCLIA